MKQLTIKDIAAQANVSTTTISRFLNGKYDSMSLETKTRIEQIIKESGYRPNNIARSLKSKYSRLIGVIISDISNPFFSTLLDTINQRALKAGYSLLISISNNSASSELKLLRKHLDNSVDGLLINTVGGNNEVISQISQSLPVVLLDRDIEGLGLPVVTSNNRQLMEDILLHLKEEQFDQVVLLTEALDTSSIRKLRADAFQEICARLDFEGKVFEIEPKNRKQIEKLTSALVSKDRITAFIAANTLVLQALLEQISKKGWSRESLFCQKLSDRETSAWDARPMPGIPRSDYLSFPPPAFIALPFSPYPQILCYFSFWQTDRESAPPIPPASGYSSPCE